MRAAVLAMTILATAACDEEEVLESGADLREGESPAQALTVHVNGFHYAAGDLSLQMEVEHYCQPLGEGHIQCVLYDASSARMIGVEHIVSRAVFDALPEAEKPLWHPHTYEVKSGMLIAPDLSPADEHALMAEIVSTYGKTWHVWDPALHEQPLDTPMLMKGFTKDGQLDPELLRRRDERYGIDSAARRVSRADIPDPGFDPVVLEEPAVCASVLTPSAPD
jgi:hypothetical protein